MRILIMTVAITLVSAFSVAKAQEPLRAPDFTLKDSANLNVTLSEVVNERTAILFFWASWCPYCKALMPHLQSIRLEYGDSVEILALNFADEDGDPVKFMSNAGYDFTTLPNADAIAANYGIHGTPGLLIIGKERRVFFDLRDIQRRKVPVNAKSNRAKAAYRAPFWAANIRLALDEAIRPES